VASGTLPGGQGWIIKLQFGLGGDCYEFDAAGRVMASTTAVPRYGYTQFQP
jgi:hypothetical protein